ncbi:hypothetical protein PVL29_008729 [Vitis rotundifolia]|uniref:BZIP domain-containing protein n=1 Tax=Vitis rotundifolia TaxID=103349 RepID=A0AA38ZYL8_VITRO|nr:hypothetical protein PVL29_008729 [Vitis rotundifolia]
MPAMQQQLGSAPNWGDPKIAVIDDRKRKRMQSNRESARRSRVRKQQHLDDMLSKAAQLQKENRQIAERIDETTELYIKFASDNNVLNAQIVELTDRLQSLNSVLQIAEEVNGLAVGIPEIPDDLLEPWQLPCPVPIMYPANMFQC